MSANVTLMQLRTLIARLDHPDHTLTNRKQSMLDRLQSAASFDGINGASKAAFASELLAHTWLTILQAMRSTTILTICLAIAWLVDWFVFFEAFKSPSDATRPIGIWSILVGLALFLALIIALGIDTRRGWNRRRQQDVEIAIRRAKTDQP
jgi:hypothetical protein